jgi:hypothetical protein
MFILFILRSVEDFISGLVSLGISEIVGFLHSFGVLQFIVCFLFTLLWAF